MPGSESGAPALHLRAVRKSYGDHEVLRGVDLDVARGQVLGLLGRNGAGKSTLIEIMCGLRGTRLEDVRIGQAGLQSAYLAIVGEEEQDNA